MTINFNQSPYFDDFDEDKKFQRILFRPGRPVQARELTQLQTILQKQIDRFGQHIFKEGSIVLGGSFDTERDIKFVKIRDLNTLGNEYNLQNFVGEEIVGQTNGLRAKVIKVEDGIETATNTKTLFVRYTTGSGTISEFENGEILTSNVANVATLSTNSTGTGSLFSIDSGVLFSKGQFLSFDAQSVIAERYSPDANCRIGFEIVETTVDFIGDPSLLDNAQGTPNFSAPGADRYKIVPILTRLRLDDPASLPDFVEVFVIKNGVTTRIFEKPQYNVIVDELAKRTFNESGDYVVNGLNVRVREHLNDNTNQGFLTLLNGGNPNLLSVGVEPGIAYVKGYEVSTLITTNIETDKGLTFENVNSQIIPARIGNFIELQEVTGAWTLDKGTTVQLFNTAQTRLTSKNWSTGAQTGNQIGTAKVKSVEYQSGTLGTPTGKVRLYLSDIKMLGSNTFTDVENVFVDNSALSIANTSGDAVLVSNSAVLKDTTSSTLIFPIGSNAVRTIRDPQGLSDTTFTFKRTQNVTIGTTGIFSTSVTIPSENFPYGSGLISTSEKRQILLNFNENVSIALDGTGANTTPNTITGTSTFFTRLNVGDKIEIADVSGTFYVNSIANNTSLTISGTFPTSFSGKVISKVYKNGDIIDLSTKGVAAGNERTVFSPSPATLTFDLKETYPSTVSATVSTKIARIGAVQVNKILRPSRYVTANCASLSSLTDPINLGFSDVYQIRSIRKDTVPFTTASQGTDVTSSFTIDNGQRDEFYDHAKIIPQIALTTSDYLLVELDYFQPDFSQGVGYFSVDSYPINDSVVSSTTIRTSEIPRYRSTTTGTLFDLRNVLDFRPVKTNSASDSTTVAGATENPAASNGFNLEANGQRLPFPESQISIDYSFFLPRIDIVAVDSERNFVVIKGTPSSLPVPPPVSDNLMALSSIFITPFPSISPALGKLLDRNDLACIVKRSSYDRVTMREIGVMKKRIENLEYFSSLNALEKSAINTAVLDALGNDRFKNGVFVDTFSSDSFGATFNLDYNIAIDAEEKSLRPVFKQDDFLYKFTSTTGQKTGDIITLPYSQVTYFEQLNSSTTKNVEQASFRFNGRLTLNPDTDTWVDTRDAEQQDITIDGRVKNVNTNQQWNSWQKTITGYNVVVGGTIRGTFNDIVSARNLANQFSQNFQDASIIEIFDQTRIGYQNVVKETTSEKIELGNFVTDVDIVTHIRPTTIRLTATGVKPNTRHYVFFDGEAMSDFCRPASSNFVPTSTEGSALTSDANGNLYILLRIPDFNSPSAERKIRFRTGTKEVVVTDNITNDAGATSSVVQYYVAQGLIQQKQNTTVSTRQMIVETIPSLQTNNGQTRQAEFIEARPRPVTRYSCCLAYSFIVREGLKLDDEGIYITSVDLFFQAKHPTLGCWFEIREMDNSGGISRNQVPLSEVRLSSAQINVTPTIQSGVLPTATRVTFPAPIFLRNNIQYAFVVHTDNTNPDYYLWVSRLGDTDLRTGVPITTRAHQGTLFTTNNDLNWVPLLDLDLMIRVNRANFDISTSRTVTFGNEPTEFFEIPNARTSLLIPGENVIGSDQLILTGITGGTIATTDKLVGQTSTSNSSVVTISGTRYFTNGTGYSAGETVNVLFANNASRGITATVSTVERGEGIIYEINRNEDEIYISNSNGKFHENDIVRGIFSTANTTITNISSLKYSLLDFEPNYLVPNKTSISFQGRTTNNANVLGNFFGLTVRNNNELNEEKQILSRSREISLLSGASSSQFRMTFSSTSSFVSPVIDTSRTHSVYVHNLINQDDSGETNPSGGNLINKYISRTVTLGEDQDAEDLKVYITAYKPPGTDIKVYAKLKNSTDPDPFDDKNWIEMEKEIDSVSSLVDKNDFRGFEFKLPDSSLTGSSGEVQYISNGITYTTYKQYSIKIGLTSNNSAVVPRVADLRAIALQI
jgi:hypothetical protein